jgi:hypothetical protein
MLIMFMDIATLATTEEIQTIVKYPGRGWDSGIVGNRKMSKLTEFESDLYIHC